MSYRDTCPKRAVTIVHHTIATWLPVTLECGHVETINWTAKVGDQIGCITCKEAETPAPKLPKMKRYQPAEQMRDGLKVYLYVDMVHNTMSAEYWYSEELRDAAMNYLNENVAKIRKARQEGRDSAGNRDAVCPYNPDSAEEIERICAEEWDEARGDEEERLGDEYAQSCDPSMRDLYE